MTRYPEGARLEPGPGGLERLVLEAAEGEAAVFVHGGHVSHFQPKGGKPVLWTSAESRFESGKPIRGGVPVCFPWFGPKAGAPEAPMHGFARILPWTVKDVRRDPRCCVITPLADKDDQSGEAKLFCHAREVATAEEWERVRAVFVADRGFDPIGEFGGAHLFEMAIAGAAWSRVEGEEEFVTTSWAEGEAVRTRKRVGAFGLPVEVT